MKKIGKNGKKIGKNGKTGKSRKNRKNIKKIGIFKTSTRRIIKKSKKYYKNHLLCSNLNEI